MEEENPRLSLPALMSPSDSDPGAPVEPPLITPDAMARILEPRVRSNAKNNSKAAKPLAPKAPPAAPIPTDETPIASAAPVEESAPAATAPTEVETTAISAGLDDLREMILALQDGQNTRDRAFDLLYEELSGYKNDFYLERLKPTLRALLFLLDSIEGFEREVEGFEKRGEAPTGEIVKANLRHFCDQLTDVFTLSEMTPIEQNGDKFDPKIQRAVEVVEVEPEQNNTVQRQIRGGWKLGGKMLRPADVVVGKSR